ncbi:MAG: hypothetical protein AAGG44_01075, partial [Planctomycetota bacterium]
MATQRPLFENAIPRSRCGTGRLGGLDAPCAGVAVERRAQRYRWGIFGITLALGLCLSVQSGSAQTLGRVARIPAGTLVEDESAKRWNQVVLLARPRIASGDVDALPKSIRDSVSSFVLTILATVKQDDLTKKFKLEEVGAGYSTYINEQLKVITSDTQRRLGAGLGFVGSRMLA